MRSQQLLLENKTASRGKRVDENCLDVVVRHHKFPGGDEHARNVTSSIATSVNKEAEYADKSVKVVSKVFLLVFTRVVSP